MIIGNPITLGGGGGLSLEVVGGTTQPTSPKDNTVWVNSELPVTAVSLGPNEPCKRSNTKNLLVYPFEKTTGTVNGVAYTDNGDGSVTANGTATADAAFRLSFVTAAANLLQLDAGTYTLSGCPAGGSTSKYRVELKTVFADLSGADLVADYGEGVTFTLDSPTTVRCNIVVSVGTTVSGLVFKPQLEKGTAATAFVKGDATGQVWINTTNKYNSNGTNASTNILRVNDNPYLEINVLNISQWDGSAWVTRENSAIYANGEWTSMALYLFNYGTMADESLIKEYFATSASVAFTANSDPTYFKPEGDYYRMRESRNSSGCLLLASEAVDLTNYTKFRAVVKVSSTASSYKIAPGIGVSAKHPTEMIFNSRFEKGWIGGGNLEVGTTQTYEMDITELTGELYCGIGWSITNNLPQYILDVYEFVLTA